MTHLHIGFAMPGCLPESEVACTNDWAQAVAILESDMNSASYAGTDEDATARMMDDVITSLKSYRDFPGDLSLPMPDGYVYFIESFEGDYTDCPAGDEPDTSPFPSVAPMFTS